MLEIVLLIPPYLVASLLYFHSVRRPLEPHASAPKGWQLDMLGPLLVGVLAPFSIAFGPIEPDRAGWLVVLGVFSATLVGVILYVIDRVGFFALADAIPESRGERYRLRGNDVLVVCGLFLLLLNMVGAVWLARIRA